MSDNIPVQPANSIRIVLDLLAPEKRLDSVLLRKLRESDNPSLKAITRATFNALFDEGKIQIKGQQAKPSSALAKGLTYIDILGLK